MSQISTNFSDLFSWFTHIHDRLFFHLSIEKADLYQSNLVFLGFRTKIWFCSLSLNQNGSLSVVDGCNCVNMGIAANYKFCLQIFILSFPLGFGSSCSVLGRQSLGFLARYVLLSDFNSLLLQDWLTFFLSFSSFLLLLLFSLPFFFFFCLSKKPFLVLTDYLKPLSCPFSKNLPGVFVDFIKVYHPLPQVS